MKRFEGFSLDEVTDPGDRRIVEETIRAHRLLGAQQIARAFLAICLTALPLAVFVVRGFDEALGLVVAGISGAIALYQLWLLHLVKKGRLPPWLDWVNSLFEVSVPTLVIIADTLRLGPVFSLTSSVGYFYAPAILISALRFRPKLTLTAGIVAVSQFALVYAWMRVRYAGELDGSLLSVQPGLVAQRAAFLLILSFAGYWIAGSLERILNGVVRSMRTELVARLALGSHVSDAVARVLLEKGGAVPGERRTVSILVCDIRGFTSWSEPRAPEDVVSVLDRHYEVATRVVEEHGGFINKFAGDGFLALFGAIEGQGDHAGRALKAALALRRRLDALHEEASGGALKVGVAVHAGETVVGTLGSGRRRDFTVIGDPVNVAARVEEKNKVHKTSILATSDVLALAPDRFLVRSVGEEPLRGRERSVGLFELLGEKTAVDGGAAPA